MKQKLTLIVPAVFMLLMAVSIFNSIRNVPAPLTTTQRIRANGYPVEEHTVETLDGYILTIIRMPYSNRHTNNNNNNNNSNNRNTTNNKPIAYLQHGMFCSSDTWIITEPAVTLAYQLVDAGYDVWLGNSRGNRYAKQHTQLVVDSEKFWKFSFHEMGIYDMRATLDYILEHTQQQSLHFISDSQGSTLFFVLLSELPQYNAVFKTAHHLGPAVFIDNVRTPYAKFAHLVDQQSYLSQLLLNREYLTNSPWWMWVCNKTCSSDSLVHPICSMSLSFFGGGWHINETVLPHFCQTHPAGAATNQIIHFAQIYSAHKFQRFDYGAELNMHYYNRSTPPEYDLAKVTACSTLYYGDNDLVADGVDIEYLARILHCAHAYKVPQQNWNHYDFVWGDRVKDLVNDRIIREMQQYEWKMENNS